MEWDRISANWAHWRDRVRERWSRLTELEITEIAGRRDHLSTRIQKTYGLSKDEVERQLRNWERNLSLDEIETMPASARQPVKPRPTK
ncbi:MAG TPA: hypothetical protein VMF52_05505 [Steroidobacteraceae bacterium]|nr:hypothetical protein [Steroidobacteraceae bacterium]